MFNSILNLILIVALVGLAVSFVVFVAARRGRRAAEGRLADAQAKLVRLQKERDELEFKANSAK